MDIRPFRGPCGPLVGVSKGTAIFKDTGWPLGKGSIHHAGGCGLQVSGGPHWNISFGALAATCIMQSYIS